MSGTTFPVVVASAHAMRTCQPITQLVDSMKPSSSSKTLIKLSIGDPTADGNIVPPDVVVHEMVDAVKSCKYNGYPRVAGIIETCEAVAEYTRRKCSTAERKACIKSQNVVMTSGASHAITLAIAALCNAGDNILVCAPSFPLYKTVCDSYAVECRYYPLQANNKWEVDLDAAAKLIDGKTKGFVMINPSNPSGSNFSRQHVQDIILFCEAKRLPIISDEIYAELVFHGEAFTSVADFDTTVPRMIISGTAKNSAVPGWRIGWAVLVDATGVAEQWADGVMRLAQLITGCNSAAQIAVGRSLLKIDQHYIDSYVRQLETGSKVYERLLQHDVGLSFAKPRASMFIMVCINFAYFKDIASDKEFYEKLLDEENVQVMPGYIFGISGFVRLTISRPPDTINEAVDRILEFCMRHRK